MVMRGRVTFSSESRHRRRAASVPAGYSSHLRISDDFPEIDSRHHVYRIASRANQDADDITAASKRHDRDFLHDINSKLNITHNGPTVVLSKPPHTSYSGASLHYHHAPSFSQHKRISTAPSVDSRRRTWVGHSVAHPVSDYEVDSYLAAAPCRPYVRSSVAMRAMSVPPVLPSSVSVSAPRWFPSSPTARREVTHVLGYRPSYRWTPSSEVRAAMDDSVVGVAHTSLYGDIVIGIPYKKRFMYNVQHGMDEVQDNAIVPRLPVNLATRVTSSSGTDYNHFVNPVYRPLADYSYTRPVSRSLLMTRPNVVARRASYAGPGFVSKVPHRHYSRYYADSADDFDLLSTNYGYHSKYLPLTRKVYKDSSYDDYLTFPYGSSSSRSYLSPVVRASSEPYSNLRTITHFAHDEHKSGLDHSYLPNPVSTFSTSTMQYGAPTTTAHVTVTGRGNNWRREGIPVF